MKLFDKIKRGTETHPKGWGTRAIYYEILLILCVIVLVNCNNNFDSYATGQFYYKQGEYEKAIEYYTIALEKDSSNHEIYLNRGKSYLYNSNFNKALLDFDQYLKIDSLNIETLRLKVSALTNTVDHRELIKTYNILAKVQFLEFDDLYNRGVAYKLLGIYDSSYQDFLQCYSINQNDDFLLSNLGIVANELGDNDQALNWFNKISEDAQKHFYLGVTYLYMKDYQRSIEESLLSLKHNSNNSNTYNNLGEAYRHLKKYKMSEENIIKAIEIDSTESNYYHSLASLYHDMGDKQEEVLALTKCLLYYDNELRFTKDSITNALEILNNSD